MIRKVATLLALTLTLWAVMAVGPAQAHGGADGQESAGHAVGHCWGLAHSGAPAAVMDVAPGATVFDDQGDPAPPPANHRHHCTSGPMVMLLPAMGEDPVRPVRDAVAPAPDSVAAGLDPMPALPPPRPPL